MVGSGWAVFINEFSLGTGEWTQTGRTNKQGKHLEVGWTNLKTTRKDRTKLDRVTL